MGVEKKKKCIVGGGGGGGGGGMPGEGGGHSKDWALNYVSHFSLLANYLVLLS